MGRDVDSLISSMRALSMTESYAIDPYIPPITFDEAALTSTKQLRVGYLMACDPIETCTASKRSVTMTINALKSQGHEVSVQDVQKKILIYYQNYIGPMKKTMVQITLNSDKRFSSQPVAINHLKRQLMCLCFQIVSDDD